MAAEDKKRPGGLLLALGLPSKKGKPRAEEEAPEDEDTDEGHEPSEDEMEAAQALLDSVEAKDAKGICTAFRALMMLCDDSSYEE